MNNNNNINYPYKAGALQGLIQSIPYGRHIPGIEITDIKALEDYLMNELQKIEREARDI